MLLTKLLLLFFPILALCSINLNTVSFIKDFFKHRRVRKLAVMSCSKNDVFKLSRSLAVPGGFYVTSLDPEEPSQEFLRSIMKRSLDKYGVFLDYDCDANHQKLIQCSEWQLLNVSFQWLVWSSAGFPRQVAEQLNLQYDSDFHWAYPEDRDGKAIRILDLYKINHTLPVNVTFAGRWDSIKGLNYTLNNYIIRRRQNMAGAVFRATIVVSNIPPDNLEKDLLDPKYFEVEAMATYNYQCYLDLQQLFNFTPELHTDKAFGNTVEEEVQSSGAILQLINREVDYAISSYIINQRRTEAVNYLPVNTWDFEISTLFRHPPVTYKWGVLLRPFEPSLWFGCLLMWFIMLVALRIISFFEAKYHVNEEERAWTWSDVFVIITGALSQQGSTMDSEWMTGRIVFLNTHILALMMNGFYAAFVVSSLLSAPSHNIKTPHDIAQSNLGFGVEDVPYYHPYFELPTDPTAYKIYREKMLPSKNRGFYTLEEGLQKLQHERFVFHTQPIKLYGIIEQTFSDHDKCDLTTINIFPVLAGHIIVPYGSPHKEMITYGYRRMIESGLIDYRNKHWRTAKPLCDLSDEISPVTLNKVCFAMWLMVGGCLLSLLILSLEMLVHSRCFQQLKTFRRKSRNEVAVLKRTKTIISKIH